MLPELTAGAIDRILTNEDVSNAVVQLLGCEQICDRYRLFISGVTSDPFILLGVELSHMVLNKELEKFTILQIDEYKYKSSAFSAKKQKVIFLTKLTVLVPGNEVNKKLGDPVNKSTTSAGAATNTPMIGTSVQLSVIPQLTTGAINRILKGEGVPKPVIQILGCRKDHEKGPFCFLISDGATSFPFTRLEPKMNHMVTNKQLLIHTVVRVDKYKCRPHEKLIELLKLTVLVPGEEIKKEIGNPVNYFTSSATNCTEAFAKYTGATTKFCGTPTKSTRAATKASARKGEAKASDSKISTVSHQDSSVEKEYEQLMMEMMFPELTSGAINRIFNGEDLANAVLQILDLKKIACASKYRYSLVISDGATGSPFAILGPEMNHLVTNKELGEFAIVQVTKCALEEINNHNVIILLSLTVVVPGNEVNEKLRNPVLPTIDIRDPEASVDAAELVVLSQLTNNAISAILSGEVVENAVILIVGCEKMPDRLYHVNIFDGVMSWPFTKLGPQLKHIGENRELWRFPVRVDKYVCNQKPGTLEEITLLGLTVLSPENESENPVNSSDVGATSRAVQQLKIV